MAFKVTRKIQSYWGKQILSIKTRPCVLTSSRKPSHNKQHVSLCEWVQQKREDAGGEEHVLWTELWRMGTSLRPEVRLMTAQYCAVLHELTAWDVYCLYCYNRTNKTQEKNNKPFIKRAQIKHNSVIVVFGQKQDQRDKYKGKPIDLLFPSPAGD